MAYDLMSTLMALGINGDYGALYPAPADPLQRPSLGPVDAAQPVQAPQPTQSPLAAAMVPQRAPQAPQANPGMFERIQHRSDASAINDGLINAGIGMLAGKDLQHGLAGALAGFNDAYDARKDKTKAENTPKVVPLADGAFSMLVFPDGTQKVVQNHEVANYLSGVKQDATEAAIRRMQIQAQFNADAAAAKDNRKVANEATDALQGTQGMISKYQNALGIIDGQGTSAQLQGIPGIKQIAGFMGFDDASKNRMLQELTVDETLLNTARTKGAISEKEMALFKSPIPSLTDDREKVWKPFIEQRLAVLQKIEAFQASQAARGNNNGYTGAAYKAPTAAPAKSGAFKYLD